MSSDKPISQIHAQIENTVDQVRDDEHISQHDKDTVLDMLGNLKGATNGLSATEKAERTSQAQAGIGILLARLMLHLPHMISKALDAHTGACPLRTPAKLPGWLALIYPFKKEICTMLCVACWSPWIGPSIARWVDRQGGSVAKVVSAECRK